MDPKKFKDDPLLWHREQPQNLGACNCVHQEAYRCFVDAIGEEYDSEFDQEAVEDSGGPCWCYCHDKADEVEWKDGTKVPVETSKEKTTYAAGSALLRKLKGLK